MTVLIFCSAYGQFKPNSIGVCYLEKDSGEYYSLTIALPFETFKNQKPQQFLEFKKVLDSIEYNGKITLFDKTGQIISIESNDKFLLEFWCENDGGFQYRPTLRTKIKKASFKRPLKPLTEIQNICCFVILDRIKQKTKFTDSKTASNTVLFGDYDRDGNIDCCIWTDSDEAGNCDGKPDNNLRIMLQVGKQIYRLRCCGP